ncbi:MAG: phage tail assembly protein [Sphingobium sp.]|uniref:phage tail assembly protein n=1 Tax=Sphingobium sp. TaxID=1912891 RepID=UPI003BB17472
MFKTHELEAPIERGDTKIDSIQIRKPKPGECRGLKMQDLATGDTSALIKLLPRVTTPALTEHEVSELMDLADLAECAGIIVDFLFTTSRKMDLPTT